MIKNLLLLLVLALSLSAQSLEVSRINLTDVAFNISIKEFPDSLKSVQLVISKQGKSVESLQICKDEPVKEILLIESGLYKVTSPEIPSATAEIRLLPGWLSILPPLLAIFLALVLRQVIVALAAGIILGSIFIYDFNYLNAVLRFVDTIMINTMINPDNAMIIVFTLLFGGVIGIISRNGVTLGISNVVTR